VNENGNYAKFIFYFKIGSENQNINWLKSVDNLLIMAIQTVQNTWAIPTIALGTTCAKLHLSSSPCWTTSLQSRASLGWYHASYRPLWPPIKPIFLSLSLVSVQSWYCSMELAQLHYLKVSFPRIFQVRINSDKMKNNSGKWNKQLGNLENVIPPRIMYRIQFLWWHECKHTFKSEKCNIPPEKN
jgi:hypothetical protein